MGIYKFKPEDAEDFARSIGMVTRHRDNQLEFKLCPYCGGKDDKFKFGINLETGQFECKRASCKARGNMITLSRDFDFSLGKDTDAYYKTADYANKSFKKFKDAHKVIESKPAAIEYLQKRGIPEEICRKYEITTKPEEENTLVFPFKDETGETVFVKYRNTAFKKGDKGSKEWCESKCKPILFGMNHCDPEADGGRLIITEGQIDSLSVAAAGFQNAVSVPTGANGFTWVPYCWDFVGKFKKIIVMGDCENGKITLSEEIEKRWRDKVYVCSIEDYKSNKDANDLLNKHGKEAVAEAINKAKPVKASRMKLLSSVAKVDIMNMPKLPTGFPTIDQVLDGGFRTGQLVVLTGRRGNGKSTLASMFAIQALVKGQKCFFYSGELPDYMFKNWLDCQVTGKTATNQSDDDKLKIWYGDRAIIYDNMYMEDDVPENSSVIETVEKAIVRDSCQFILIDNLMTAIEDDLQIDIYRAQSRLVGRLAALAKRYDCLIVLVAHPRKGNGTSKMDNDDVAGSSHITDRADIVMMIRRPTEEESRDETMKYVSITKNRLTGKLKDDIAIYYDPTGTRRLAESSEDFSIRYPWDGSDPYDFEDVPDDIPF